MTAACAHRGDVKHFPENTLPAFAAAVAKGAHMIELDVYLTRDGVPVIIHGHPTLNGGRQLPAPVSILDIAPTLVDWHGVPVPEHWMGHPITGG